VKLHLGAGYRKYDGYLNVDLDPLCNPDYNFDITDAWPFPDNSVDGIIAHHVMEHLGEGFFKFIQEMYRVCKPNTFIDIVVPHHRHYCFLNDPTHRRPITIEGMKLFSKAYNKYCIETGDASSRLGQNYNVDYDIVKFKYNIDPKYQHLLVDMKPGSQEETDFSTMLREKNNMIVDVEFTMVVLKDE